MEEEGMKIIEHINKLSVMGFKEVVVHLPRIWKIMINTISFIEKVKQTELFL